MTSSLDVEGILKSCHCGDAHQDEPKIFVYVEGTKLDRSISEDDSILTNTVWYNMKPPLLFSTEYFPAVTARQVQIKRIQLKGKRKLAGDDEGNGTRERISVSIHKKKSAVKFLSNTSLPSIS